MKNNEKVLLGLSCFLGGVVVGFFIAPIKRGIYCGNNSGNNVSSAEDLKKIVEKNLDKDISEINE